VTPLPPPVGAVCTTFLSAVPEGLVTGLYLRGGLGFGEWVEGKSDVDFLATLAVRPGPDEVAALRRAHELVAERHGDAPYLDGPHLLAADLTAPPDLCPDVPAVLMHRFREQGRNELHPAAWHELAGHSITVLGPPVEDLAVWTDDAVLRDFTIDNLDTDWRGHAESCTASPEGAAVPFACEWVVPGVARLHHLLVTGEQTAKSRAVRWGLDFYPERFHRVLRESLAIREGAFERQYDDPVERGRDVGAFASYVVEQGVVSSRG
jgi:Aminoglycoside adenylyltransferase, C-terminal domain